MDRRTESDGPILFCHKCGRRLLPESQFCSTCGARMDAASPAVTEGQEAGGTAPLTPEVKAEPVQQPQVQAPGQSAGDAAPEGKGDKTRKKRKLWMLGIPVLALALVGAGFLAAWKFLPTQTKWRDRAGRDDAAAETGTSREEREEVETADDQTTYAGLKRRDIDQIDGCPEFYDVKFGMTAEEISARVEVEHLAYPAEEWDMEDSLLAVEEDAGFSLYGFPVSTVYCDFDGLELDSVFITFPDEEVSLDQVLDIYTRAYGEPTKVDGGLTRWLGRNTEIKIFASTSTGKEDDTIVYYGVSPNRKYTHFTFDGPEHDPCNFLKTDVFNKRPEDYAAGLTLDEDYDVNQNDYFSEYIFYPYFGYMGIDDTDTAISLQRDASGGNITVCNYLFWLEESDAADRIAYIKNALTKEYGLYSSCDYTSLRYDEFGMVEVSFDEMLARIESGTQGIYHVQWKKNGVKVTLELTIYSDSTYYDGAVAMAPMQTRFGL